MKRALVWVLVVATVLANVNGNDDTSFNTAPISLVGWSSSSTSFSASSPTRLLVASISGEPKGSIGIISYSLYNPSSSTPVWYDMSAIAVRVGDAHYVLHTDLFDCFDNSNANRLTYQGIREKRGIQSSMDFSLLKPGATATFQLSLGATYGMVDGGVYQCSSRQSLSIAVIVGARQPNSSSIRYLIPLITNSVTLKLSGYVARTAQEEHDRLINVNINESTTTNVVHGMLGVTSISFISCTQAQIDIVNDAVTMAKQQLGVSRTWLTGDCDGNFVDIFGSYQGTSRWNSVSGAYLRAESRINNSFKIYCSAPLCRTNPPNYAYVFPYDTYYHTIHLCGKFWLAPNTANSLDTRWGTLIHELMHFDDIQSCDDWSYGLSSCRDLARTTPSKAVDNSDSFEYFSETLTYAPLC